MHVRDELSESPGPSACCEHVLRQAVSVRSVVGTTRRDDTSARTARQIVRNAVLQGRRPCSRSQRGRTKHVFRQVCCFSNLLTGLVTVLGLYCSVKQQYFAIYCV